MIALQNYNTIGTSTIFPIVPGRNYSSPNSNNPSTTIKFYWAFPELSQAAGTYIQKINSFSNLQENWDSYGAEKPSAISIEKAKQFIRFADKDGLEVYFTAPGRNADVLVEFRLSSRVSAEIYFKSDGTNELLIFEDNECIAEGTIEENYLELMNYKNEFH